MKALFISNYQKSNQALINLVLKQREREKALSICNYQKSNQALINLVLKEREREREREREHIKSTWDSHQ